MRLSGRQEGAAGGAPQGRRGMKGADAQQFARAAARGRQVDLTSDCCCCSRVVFTFWQARLHVLANPRGQSLPHPTVPLPPNLTAPTSTPVQIGSVRKNKMFSVLYRLISVFGPKRVSVVGITLNLPRTHTQ